MTDRVQQLDEEIRRAESARQVIEHPLFQEAFNTLRAEVVQQWETSPASDTEGREKLWLILKAADRAQAHLVSLMETGKLAAAEKHRLRDRLNPWAETRRGLL
ncbi:MAG TPA: hypothetical protein VFM34_05200 [Moraxellaceae bacterium]|nr:hypothetical protein [Moraxellaceae bacterium]